MGNKTIHPDFQNYLKHKDQSLIDLALEDTTAKHINQRLIISKIKD